MTDDELKALVASLAVGHAKTDDVLRQAVRDAAKSRAETDAVLRQSNLEAAKSRAETDAVLRQSNLEAAKSRAETDAVLRKSNLDAAIERAKTDEAMRELSRQIGGLSNKFGSFTEGLALPSMSQILTERFHAQVIAPRVRARRGGKELEIDVFAYSNGARNAAYVVEVKSHLNEEALEQIQRTLGDFPKFFPEHRSKDLYGILAGVHVSESVARQAIKAGIYVARISNDVFRLQVPAGFRPHSFRIGPLN